MPRQLIPASQRDTSTTIQESLSQEDIARLADAIASQNQVSDYLHRQSQNTRRNQHGAIRLFLFYLQDASFLQGAVEDVLPQWEEQAAPWKHITYGLVESFRNWMLIRNYKTSSVNVYLATIRSRCKLAYRAGVIPIEIYSQIALVEGYSEREGERLDEERDLDIKNTPLLSPEQLTLLKTCWSDTPQGRRDRVLFCFLCDHGLRRGEAAGLKTSGINLVERTFTLYREKVNKWQTQELSPETLAALAVYLEQDQPEEWLLQGSNNRKKLIGRIGGNSVRKRVLWIGKKLFGREDLHPHLLRHAWATYAARAGIDILLLRDRGGWSSLAMPARYVESAKVIPLGQLPSY